MAKYYAHSTFPVKVNEWGQVEEKVVPGDEISQAKLGVSDEEWENYIEIGVVSEEEYPDIPDDVSPAEYATQQAAQAAVLTDLEGAEELSLTAPVSGSAKVDHNVPTEKEAQAAAAASEKPSK